MSKKYKYLQVHTLHYTLVDEEGNDNGKVYEYDGDHSLFCDGIDFNDLKEITKAYDAAHQLNRIASALEEILRLVKADQEKMEKRLREEN